MGAVAHRACCALTRILDSELALMNETYREAVLERETSREDAYRLALAARGSRAEEDQRGAAQRQQRTDRNKP